ncbi:MAG: hypothetical protein Q9219_005494 [cf. Caloplaca sp. 3 TL-2023]
MAPKRKNKKSVANPARGFATTSIASKAKPSIDDGKVDIPTTEDTPDKGDQTRPGFAKDDQSEKGLHELSPEELEKRLEQSDLDLFLETYREKVQRDSSRQINKLQTEKRLLRAQAEPLQMRSWLSSEILEVILETIKGEHSKELRPQGRKHSDVADLSEDELCTKVWTLRQVLVQLGFSHESCDESLQHLLLVRQDSTVRETLVGKDCIWGLECCLDWLALHCDAQRLPPYVSLPVREPLSISQAASRSSSRSSLPMRTDADVLPHDPATQTLQSSDTESDSDPDLMTDKFIGLQTRLYELEPEYDVIYSSSQTKHRTNSQKASESKLPSQLSKILRRLQRLQSDILFDRRDAERRWSEKRVELARAATQRKKLQLDEQTQPDTIPPSMQEQGLITTNQVQSIQEDSQEDAGAEALGEFFSGLPDNYLAQENATSCPSSSGPPISIRNFGKWHGISPRRILEDACRARDASVRITYQLIDRSPFSKQHSVHIQWSNSQPRPLESPNATISCEASERHVRVKMETEATPDAVQSEAYVSTAALFLIFSSVPKEEKASIRLPSTWKDLWLELFHLKRERDLAADRNELREIRSLVEARPKDNEEHLQKLEDVNLKASSPNNETAIEENSSTIEPKTPEHLKALWSSKSATPSFHSFLRQRQTLPISGFRNEILETIEKNQIVILCGETGCGKSTQVPSFILERELSVGRACKIYCTEPRRISAISLARRVSEELGERKSDVGTSKSLVGYAIRMESKVVRETKLIFATTGIVMRMLESSNDLLEVTHLVLDEVHERSIESDFLLIVLRKLLARRPALKVILMSATVDATKFSNYFVSAPILTVPGRTFPVESRYLEDVLEETKFTIGDGGSIPLIDDIDEDEDLNSEPATKDQHISLAGYSSQTRTTLADLNEYRINYDLILSLLERIATKQKFRRFSKAILVFLPGIAEIRRLHDMLSNHPLFSKKWIVHALHSSIAMDEQERAFKIPPPGYRKIVLATNIAETGVTIPDVTCVVDTGKHKEMRFDERRQLSRLIEVFISRSNAKQRRGRAGRVQEGLCFHLFTKARHDSTMAQEQTPELLRLSLQDLVLRVKLCNLGSIEQTLSEAIDPPTAKNIRRAIDALIDVKALTVSEELTSLGRQLAKLPLDVFLGKLILLGCIFRCLDGALSIAAILSSKSPFPAPMGSRSQADQARLAFKKGDSDPLTVYNAYCSWRRTCQAGGASEYQFCRKNFLSQQNLVSIEELKAQLAISLIDAGFLELQKGEEISLNKIRSWSSKRTFVEIPARYNARSTDSVLDSIICWSFYPKLLKRDGKGWRNIANNQAVSVHPASVNKSAESAIHWLSFYAIMQSSNKFYNAHETSAVEPFAFILACGEADIKMYSGVIVIDGNRIRFAVDDWKTMLAIKILRQKLRQIMGQLYRDPGHRLSVQQQTWLEIWEKIFARRDEKSVDGKK